MNGADNYSVNPDTGDVLDPEGNLVGNLGEDHRKKGKRTQPSGITIYLRGPRLDPTYVTSVIGIEPDVSWKNGDIVGTIRPIEQKSGLWQFDIPNDILSITDAINWLKENASSFDGQFTKIDGVANAEIDVLIFLKVAPRSGTYAANIDPTTLQWIASSGATLSFSVYYDEESLSRGCLIAQGAQCRAKSASR